MIFMKKLIASAAQLLATLVIFSSCSEEPSLSPITSSIDLVPMVASLNLQIRYPDSGSFDSAYIVFKNSDTEVKQKLILDNSTYAAVGVIPNITAGKWNISASFFSTIIADYESLEKSVSFNLIITPTATDLITDETSAFVKDGKDPIRTSIRRTEFYFYQLYSAGLSAPEGFVRLPADPADAFVEIGTFNQKWIYAYVDRSFYNSSLDGISNFYQGGGAFEIYGSNGTTYDRLPGDIIDTTSLVPGIYEVRSKEWNFVDCLVMIEGLTYDQSLVIYHVWDFRTSNSGGRSRSDAAIWDRTKIEKRKRNYLH
jgi:hypothetical protein